MLNINLHYWVWLQGSISAADIEHIAKEVGESFTPGEIREMIEEADRNGTATILCF